MVRTLRGAIVALAVAFLGLFAAALPSSAAESPAPSVSATTYGCADVDAYPAQAVCLLHVKVAPVCDGDLPELSYNVVAEGTDKKVVTITFKNPGGKDIVYANLPLSGTILWPGAVVGPDGEAADWPGWTKQADGSWTAGDEYSWARPGVEMNFEVNPGADAAAAYPPATSMCANPPDSEVLAEGDPTTVANVTTSAVLSETGSNDAPLLITAIALVVIGGAAVTFVTISRRRRQDA